MLEMPICTPTPVKALELVGADGVDMEFVLPSGKMIVGAGEILACTLPQDDEEHTIQVGIPAAVSQTKDTKAVKVAGPGSRARYG